MGVCRLNLLPACTLLLSLSSAIVKPDYADSRKFVGGAAKSREGHMKGNCWHGGCSLQCGNPPTRPSFLRSHLSILRFLASVA